jgi:asparagine synthase (glutamine-hydrolysing)
MCGIAGKLDFGGTVDEELIHGMCAAIEHRGPDSRGVYAHQGVGLGAQRLAIIDVAGGQQPIFNEDGSLACVMNGEIYNYQDLRRRLRASGHRLASEVDTEVLVHLYEDYGSRMVEHLRGMFAFAIWDDRRRCLFCARDRVGKKPLFWARRGSKVWFASEIGALLVDPDLDTAVDHTAIAAYLALQYVPHPRSAFEAIQKLPPASTLTVTESGERIEKYWALDYSKKQVGVPDAELEEQLREHIRDATRVRLMSEVPLGAFLSGGIDSSAVVGAMAEQMTAPVKTFSIGFSEADHDELHYARMIAEQFGTDHHEFVVEPKALDIMPKLARHYGEPFADSSAIPSFYLAELTGRHVTVALNGDGGDESFAGYHRYVTDDRVRQFEWLPAAVQRSASLVRFVGEGPLDTSTRTRINRLGRLLAMSPQERYALRMSMFDGARQARLLTPEFAASVGDARPDAFVLDAWAGSAATEHVDVMLDTDVQTYLPGDLLVKMDIATMAYSVEARSPFLDHHLMEFAASLPSDQKLHGTSGKRLLMSALRGWLPDEVLDRRKMGFGVPLAHWFRNDLRELPRDVLLDQRSLDRGYFQPAEIERLIKEHGEGRADHSSRLWVLLQLEFWHREVVEAPRGRIEPTVEPVAAT